MDFPGITQLASNFGLAVILAAGFLWVAYVFVSKTMPQISENQSKALAEQRGALLEVIKEQREGGMKALNAIVVRLERMDEDLTAIKRVILTNETRRS